MHKVIELCLSTHYFIFGNRVSISENSGPIALALMVVISRGLSQRFEDKTIQEVLRVNLGPLSYKRYVDDSHARFEAIHQSHNFLNILNKQNKALKYTMEKEDQSQKLNFSGVTIINTSARKHEFRSHH